MRSVTDDTLRDQRTVGKEKYRLGSCPRLTGYGVGGRERVISPLVHNLGRWSKVLSFTPQSLYPQRNGPLVPNKQEAMWTPGTGLDEEKRKFGDPWRETNHSSQVVQAVA